MQDHIEFHNIYLGPDNLYRAQRKSTRLTTVGYHSDVLYEHQPPAITILSLLQVPSTGGDTGWVSQVAAYERLSEPIQNLLEGLRAEHSGFPQAEGAVRDGKHVRRAPVISKHPIVRVHPVTGKKALFVNPGFTKRIEGLKAEESEALLKLLFTVSHDSSSPKIIHVQRKSADKSSVSPPARICSCVSNGMTRRLHCGTIESLHIQRFRITMSTSRAKDFVMVFRSRL